jgi:tripartite ATP-independent transporter DctP family solute receptor
MKRKSLIFLALAVCFLMIFSVVGCGQQESEPEPEPEGGEGESEGGDELADIQELEFGIASSYESEHILVKACEKAKELIEERSGGKITVNLFPGGVMGGEEDITEAVTAGGMEMQAGGGIGFNLYAQEHYYFDSPFVMKDWDHMQAYFASDLFEEARQLLRNNGNTDYVGYLYRGMRQFTSNKPIRTPEDIKGLQLRLPMLETWVVTWEAVGALPIPIPLNELYTSLATGVADASEGDIEQIWSFALYEVQDHISLTSHQVQTGHMYVNAEWWDGLNEATRNLIQEAFDEALEWGSETVIAREQDLLKEMEEKHGVTIVEDVDRDAMLELAKPAIEGLFETQWASSWDEVLNIN